MTLRLLPFLLVMSLGACMKAPDPDVGLRQASGEANAAQETESTEPPQVSMPALEGWTETPTSLGFQLARWELPEGGHATISWLGASSDTIAMNLDRWLGQWQTATGAPAQDGRLEPDQEGNHPFTFVRVEGTLTDTRQVGGGDPRAEWMLLGAIVESPRGPLYVKVVGAQSVLGEQETAFREAVRALTVD